MPVPLPSQFTPRNRVWGTANQYFDPSSLVARTTGVTFIASSPLPRPGIQDIDNWSDEIEKEWDGCL
jgi:hypothetical protein